MIFIFLFKTCFKYIVSAFSPLATILTQNKLTGNNYVEWKRNLNILLTTEDHIYVLSTPYPLEPPANAATAVKREFNKWKKSNVMACCYMLASIDRKSTRLNSSH